VSIPPNGEVTFVNDSGARMTLTVGGSKVPLADGESRRLGFDGADRERSVAVSGTAIDLPLAGSLTSTTGTVNIGARRAAADPSPTQQGASPVPSAPQPAPATPAEPSAAGQSPASAARNADGSERAGGRDGMPSPQAPPGPAVDQADEGTFAAPASGNRGVRGTKVTTVSGSGSLLGLLILVATVLLGGVGSAAIRSLLALRDPPRPAR
jgi:hypothetical protein